MEKGANGRKGEGREGEKKESYTAGLWHHSTVYVNRTYIS